MLLLEISLINFHFVECGKIFNNNSVKRLLAHGKEKKVSYLMTDFLYEDRDWVISWSGMEENVSEIN